MSLSAVPPVDVLPWPQEPVQGRPAVQREGRIPSPSHRACVEGTGEDRAEPRRALGAGHVLFSRAELWSRHEVVPASAPCCASWGEVLALSEPWVLTCTPRRLRAQRLLLALGPVHCGSS